MNVPGLTPHYTPDPSDPEWLTKGVLLHGHLGPWLAIGGRIGLAGLERLGRPGYFDLDVLARGPFGQTPQSCLLDGLQVTTGATLGKCNVRVEITEAIEVVITHTKSNTSVRLAPAAWVFDELAKLTHERMEALARELAVVDADRLLVITD